MPSSAVHDLEPRTNTALVDPELLPLLDLFPLYPVGTENLAAMRGMEMVLPDVGNHNVEVQERRIRRPDGDIGLRIYRPMAASGPLGCIFHIHGGGFILGSAQQMEHEHRPLADQLQCVIASVDYRLAPEFSFPANIEDCYAGLSWVFANATEIGVDPGRIGVMGESAGGGLAAALAILARDRDEYALRFQHLIYPMLDDRTCVREKHPFAGQFVWDPDNNRFGWASLLGHEPGLDTVSPYAAPARAENLDRLPPTFLHCGALDLFVDENMAYAQRLIRAGVPTELHIWPGAFHAFEAAPEARVSVAARQASLAALRRALADCP